ncbi:hypothetical protein B0H19DRAFT_1268494 [Mycena capillaripes]|nr:hypothetical protein B0H19DRAFT_1268494 [Mycena capillaripes]
MSRSNFYCRLEAESESRHISRTLPTSSGRDLAVSKIFASSYSSAHSSRVSQERANECVVEKATRSQPAECAPSSFRVDPFPALQYLHKGHFTGSRGSTHGRPTALRRTPVSFRGEALVWQHPQHPFYWDGSRDLPLRLPLHEARERPPDQRQPAEGQGRGLWPKIVDSMTMLKTIWGTPSYLAPEVVTQQNSSGYDSLSAALYFHIRCGHSSAVQPLPHHPRRRLRRERAALNHHDDGDCVEYYVQRSAADSFTNPGMHTTSGSVDVQPLLHPSRSPGVEAFDACVVVERRLYLQYDVLERVLALYLPARDLSTTVLVLPPTAAPRTQNDKCARAAGNAAPGDEALFDAAAVRCLNSCPYSGGRVAQDWSAYRVCWIRRDFAAGIPIGSMYSSRMQDIRDVTYAPLRSHIPSDPHTLCPPLSPPPLRSRLILFFVRSTHANVDSTETESAAAPRAARSESGELTLPVVESSSGPRL